MSDADPRNPNFLQPRLPRSQFDLLSRPGSIFGPGADWETLANMHARAQLGGRGNPLSPFVSLTTDVDKLIRSTDHVYVNSIVWDTISSEGLSNRAAPHIGIFEIPQTRLRYPTWNLAVEEGETLFLGYDLEQYLFNWVDNQYRRRPLPSWITGRKHP